MKIKYALLSLVAAAAMASTSQGAIVSLSFASIGIESGSSTTFSTAGDTWRATNVQGGDGTMDALFTITGTEGVAPANVAFVNEVARGENMRVRIGAPSAVGNALVFITITLVNAGTSTPYTGTFAGSELATQFSDLDSDAGNNRTDLAGALTSRLNGSQLAASTLLSVTTAPTFAPTYTTAALTPAWGPIGNVTGTDAVSQSPVTALFTHALNTSLNIVVGQRVVGSITANRHIDIDMTPDFAIVDAIPEPTSVAILGSMLGMMTLRRRRA